MAKLDFLTIIITLGVTVLTVYLCYNIMLLNTDYGVNGVFIRFLAVVGVVLTIPMIGGCVMRLYDFTQEDLESIGESAKR